jgi:hypothetical protein
MSDEIKELLNAKYKTIKVLLPEHFGMLSLS